jgi:hypothetical protein
VEKKKKKKEKKRYFLGYFFFVVYLVALWFNLERYFKKDFREREIGCLNWGL